MRRGKFFILTFVGIFIIGVAAVISTKLIGKTQKIDTKSIEEGFNQFGLGISKLIANSGFVEDAFLIGEPTMLSEYNIRFKRASSLFNKIYFLGADGKVISATDTTMIGKKLTGEINFATLKSKGSYSQAKEGNSIYASSIQVGDSIFGYVVTEINTKIESSTAGMEGNLPLSLIPGIVVAIVGGIIFGFIAMAFAGRIEEDITEELAAQQEAVFSPRVRKLKKETEELDSKRAEITSEIKTQEEKLVELANKKEELDQKLQEHPVVKSIDKLKESEKQLMEDLNTLKQNKEKMEEDIKKLEDEREEISRKIEIDRQEEKTLHEKLELIKKKILKLE